MECATFKKTNYVFHISNAFSSSQSCSREKVCSLICNMNAPFWQNFCRQTTKDADWYEIFPALLQGRWWIQTKKWKNIMMMIEKGLIWLSKNSKYMKSEWWGWNFNCKREREWLRDYLQQLEQHVKYFIIESYA